MLLMIKRLKWIFWLALMAWLAGCGGTPQVESPTPGISPEVIPTSTSEPTPIPTPTPLPATAVLWAPPEADQVLVQAIQETISQSATEVGMRFQVQPALSLDFINAERVQWVVALAPAVGLNDLVIAAPQTRFLAVGVQGLAAAPNLSVISAMENGDDQQGFMAGYLAAVMTPDWRVGVIGIADSEAGQLARRSFLTGAKFFCGFCSPTYPPYHEYPLYVQVNGAATAAEWQSAADLLLQKNVETIFIVPGAGDENLMRYLASSGVGMIGTAPPPDDLRDAWVATLGYHPLEAFHNFWPEFVAGSAGGAISVPLSLSDIHYGRLSPGQVVLVEKMLAEVESGYIQLIGPNIP
jgi:hypothetical protein